MLVSQSFTCGGRKGEFQNTCILEPRLRRPQKVGRFLVHFHFRVSPAAILEAAFNALLSQSLACGGSKEASFNTILSLSFACGGPREVAFSTRVILEPRLRRAQRGRFMYTFIFYTCTLSTSPVAGSEWQVSAHLYLGVSPAAGLETAFNILVCILELDCTGPERQVSVHLYQSFVCGQRQFSEHFYLIASPVADPAGVYILQNTCNIVTGIKQTPREENRVLSSF